jgi:hypothetical protein
MSGWPPPSPSSQAMQSSNGAAMRRLGTRFMLSVAQRVIVTVVSCCKRWIPRVTFCPAEVDP